MFNKLYSPQVSGQVYFLIPGCNPTQPLKLLVLSVLLYPVTHHLSLPFIFQLEFLQGTPGFRIHFKFHLNFPWLIEGFLFSFFNVHHLSDFASNNSSFFGSRYPQWLSFATLFSHVTVRQCPLYFPVELLDALRSCTQHDMVTARLTLEQPGTVIHF